MKFLLTSPSIRNNSIRNALVDLLGKPMLLDHTMSHAEKWAAGAGVRDGR